MNFKPTLKNEQMLFRSYSYYHKNRKEIEKRKEKYKIAYLKMDVVTAHEEKLMRDTYGIEARTVYAGDLCPDHAEVMILMDAIKWAEGIGAELLIVESAGLCLRCSPFLNQGVGVVVLSMLSGLHSVDKMKQLICFADIAMLTMNDLVCQAEREVYIKKLKNINIFFALHT